MIIIVAVISFALGFIVCEILDYVVEKQYERRIDNGEKTKANP